MKSVLIRVYVSVYYVHNGLVPEQGEHTLRLIEQGTTGEAANLIVDCSCGTRQSMEKAFGQEAWKRLPACRGRHAHLDTFEPCGAQTRILGLMIYSAREAYPEFPGIFDLL